VQRAEAGDEMGLREREIGGLEQSPEGSTGIGVQRGDGLREMGADGATELPCDLLFGAVVMGRDVIDGGQGGKCAPGVTQQAGDDVHSILRFRFDK